MVGFIANAGMNVQGNIMKLLPQQIEMPELPHMTEISASLEAMKQNPELGDMFKGMPDLSNMNKMDMGNMSGGNSNIELSPEILEMLQSSDVTTIVESTKTMSDYMFNQVKPMLVPMITMGMNKGIDGMREAASHMTEGKEQLETLCNNMEEMRDALPDALDKAGENYLAEIDNKRAEIEECFQSTLNEGFSKIYILTAITSAITLIILAFYTWNKKKIAN